jgi:hypothetical protein
MGAKKRAALELHEDPVFERRQWLIQRISWIAIVLLLVLALAGAFGNGYLSRASVADGALHVEYERFVHADAPTTLRIRVGSLDASTTRIAIDRELADAIHIQGFLPQPTHSLSTSTALILEFETGGERDLRVTLDANPQSPGFPRGAIRILNPAQPAEVRLRQLIYP